MKISCVTASYVADVLGYPGEIDWGRATELMAQAPLLATIEGLLERLAPAQLDGIEFFFPHVAPRSITPVLAAEVHRLLEQGGLACSACAGSVADPTTDPYGCEAAFNTARLLNAPLIAGHISVTSLAPLSAVCRQYGVRVAFENGSETDAQQMLNAVQGGDEWVGMNIDTGNMAAQGGDPVRAIYELGSRIMHVHLKDVPGVGSHDCVALGEGIVDLPAVLSALRAVGFDGWLSIEIETGDRDPTDEIIASARKVRELLRA